MDMLAGIDKQQARQFADKILSSVYFRNSPRQQQFFDYLVRHSLSGEIASLKGYTIGVEVFERDKDFDPSVDSIVRVEATRIRNKLREYYEKEGVSDEIRIHFRKGSYKLEFGSLALSGKPQAVNNNAYPALVTSKPSLVVLPFVSISADHSRDYFADGITDSLISLLSRLSGLFIISRQSSFAYKDTIKTSKVIATELGVQYLLEGSIQHAGDRVRIAAHLVNASDSTHIWSERFDRDLTDIFTLQDEITQQIANALQVQLTAEEDKIFGLKATNNLAAYDTLLRGMATYLKYSPQTTKDAISLFQEVLALDADYVAANAWLARALSFMWAMNWERSREVLDSAYHYAQHALGLEPESPYANAIMGWTLMWRDEAESSIYFCKKAVTLDPNNAEALLFLSMTLSSANYGAEALIYIEKVMRHTPTSATFNEYALGNCYYALKDYGNALAAYERGIKLNANFLPNHYGQICTLVHLEKHQVIRDKLSTNKQLAALVTHLSVYPIWNHPELIADAEEIRKQIFVES
jgi:TolB-like protein/Tfp pilus assembly protein PilF